MPKNWLQYIKLDSKTATRMKDARWYSLSERKERKRTPIWFMYDLLGLIQELKNTCTERQANTSKRKPHNGQSTLMRSCRQHAVMNIVCHFSNNTFFKHKYTVRIIESTISWNTIPRLILKVISGKLINSTWTLKHVDIHLFNRQLTASRNRWYCRRRCLFSELFWLAFNL